MADHPMFEEVKMRSILAQEPILLSREIGPTDIGEELGKMAQEGVEESVSDEVFAGYQYKEILEGCLPHPADIVEPGSLAALSPPEATYPLQDSLPQELILEGKLSGLQLEGVLYACQRHQMLLPNGSRAGFFIGDGAGVGKGRQISGLVLDNFARGRTKHVWFSISSDLIVDARRDLADIGCYVKVIEGCQQLDRETRVFGLPSDFKDGVIFSTYATLVSSVQKGGALSSSRHSRLQQLIDWCGGDQFDGCLVFDECHKAKNFVPGKDHASTKVALAVSNIQRLLPKARVVYCSATGVTDVKNMAFMERLGLWGEGATFKSFDQFIDTVQKKGLGVAEMLAMEMKSSGMYLSRGLSFKQAQFETEEVCLTKEQMKMYNLAAHVWNEVRKSLEHAILRCSSANNRVWASFWGAHQRFFKQMCMAMKVPAIVAETKRALAENQCVVIGLQTTGEASMEVEISKNTGPLPGFVSLCREMLTRFIEQHYPTVVEGKSSLQGPIEDDWCNTAKQLLLGFARQIALPDSPLDELIHRLGGPSQVAEMTGRKGRIVKYSESEAPHYELRASSDSSGEVESLNVQERNQFMDGKKFIAIISDAASTGISLHADKRCENQRRRVHLTIELPWSADKAVQQLGRSHRSNQSSGPLYKLMTTNLGGERRFAAAVAKRLQSLGALTKGDRRAATGADLEEFNFDTPYGRHALKSMYAAICQKEIANGVSVQRLTKGTMDFSEFNDIMVECLNEIGVIEPQTFGTMLRVKENVSTDVGRFLNRILGLKVEQQNLIFNYFCKCLAAHVSMAKKEGRYNEGLVDITSSSVELIGKPRELFKEKNGSSNNPTRHLVLTVDRGMTWDRALLRLDNFSGDKNGFYCSRREIRGKKLYLLATLKETAKHTYKIARPNTGLSAFDEEEGDLLSKYIHISKEKAESGWREQYEHAESHCIHGPHCKTGPSCSVGARCYRMHLLCGGIVTMMSLLESTLAKYGPKLQLTKSEMHLRVVRVKLNSGERIVGIRVPEMIIPLAEKELQDQKTVEEMMRRQMKLTAMGMSSSQMLQNGLTIQLPESPKKDQVRKMTLIEDVSLVNQRLLTKAITPPVTIKNFFKPVEKCSSSPLMKREEVNNGKNKGGKVKGKGKSGGVRSLFGDKKSVSSHSNNDCGDFQVESGEKLCNGTSGEINGATVFAISDDSNSCNAEKLAPDNSAKVTENSTSSSTVGESNAAFTNSSGSGLLTVKRSSSSGSINSLTGSTSKKRTNSSLSFKNAPPNKKSKQGNIMSSFAKQKTIKEDKDEKQLICPICNIKFPVGTLNVKVNEHVDNCLIE